MNTQTKKLHEAVEIVRNEFSFIKDLKFYVENDITITGGFNYMKCYNGFGEIIEHPIFELRFKFLNTEHFGGINTLHYTTEQIVEVLKNQIIKGLKLMKSSDEEASVEYKRDIFYRYDYPAYI